MIENYSVKVPGYSGHKPMNSINEKGVKPQNPTQQIYRKDASGLTQK